MEQHERTYATIHRGEKETIEFGPVRLMSRASGADLTKPIFETAGMFPMDIPEWFNLYPEVQRACGVISKLLFEHEGVVAELFEATCADLRQLGAKARSDGSQLWLPDHFTWSAIAQLIETNLPTVTSRMLEPVLAEQQYEVVGVHRLDWKGWADPVRSVSAPCLPLTGTALLTFRTVKELNSSGDHRGSVRFRGQWHIFGWSASEFQNQALTLVVKVKTDPASSEILDWLELITTTPTTGASVNSADIRRLADKAFQDSLLNSTTANTESPQAL